MCKVRSGAKIRNQQDVQNLVTGIIFRQRGAYRINDILKIVLPYMKGSQYKISEDDLYCIIADTLDMLCIRSRIKCKNGIYSPLPFKVISTRHQIAYN